MASTKTNKTRPKLYSERRILAEDEYRKLYAKFKTHTFTDWGILTQVQEEDQLMAVPPYSERFDEFLGYWIGCCEPIGVPALMEYLFPEPDGVDCIYIKDLIVELEHIATWGNQIYKTYKGSKLEIGPAVCWCYTENVARAKKWVQDVERKLNQKPKSLIASDNSAPLWPALLKNGFTVADLDQLLIQTGLLNDARQYTMDSKPRTWRAVIEALRDTKYLDNAKTAKLALALEREYGKGPSHRSIQGPFNKENPDAQAIYQRALGYLRRR